MIDKVQKIREEVARIQLYTQSEVIKQVLDYIDKVQEEPVSEDLEEAAIQFATDTVTGKVDVVKQGSFFWGAQWKERQFEKNRLKHCDSITNEQAELEQGFIDQHLDKHQRMPTFLDAIEYGMRLQKEQIEEALLSEVLPCFMHGGEADEVVAKLDEVLSQKKYNYE